MVPNPDGLILPGMFARVVLEGRIFAGRLLVPKEAVIERDGRTLVFAFDALDTGVPGAGLAKWTYVTVGLANDKEVEIVEGDASTPLGIGTIVLTGGHLTLVHDARIRLAGAVESPTPE
jgi:multidrug efflux pump subunit AcrA (membrane-fusion protein)